MTFGFRELYLNVMPFRLGGKRFRHKTELDYLCHLQAVVSLCKVMNVMGGHGFLSMELFRENA